MAGDNGSSGTTALSSTMLTCNARGSRSGCAERAPNEVPSQAVTWQVDRTATYRTFGSVDPPFRPGLRGYLDVVVPRVSLNTRSTRLYGLLLPLQLEDRDLPSRNRVREDPGAKLCNFTVHRLSLVTG